MQLLPGKRIYFASDFHLGVPTKEKSLEREKSVVRWLDSIKHDASEIFLVGDIFDFWFEYKHAIPKGFVRLQGKIAELVDNGIPVHFFTGNHDMWMFDYFEQELGITMYRTPTDFEWNGTTFLIGHGDGLGPGDKWYKFMKKCFEARWTQWSFARIHPNFGIGMANFWSRKSRAATGDEDSTFLGEENEWLAIYSKEENLKKHRDFYVFGHRHLPMDIDLGSESRYINLGEWINYNSYAYFDGEKMTLTSFEK